MDSDRRNRMMTEAMMQVEEGKRKEAEHKALSLQGMRISELEALTERGLVEKHDALVDEATNTAAQDPEQKMRILQRAQVYADELARRKAAEQEERMETLTESLNRLTWWIVALTVFIAIATLVSVGLTAWTLLAG